MKKIYIIALFLILLTGCAKQDILECEIGNTVVTITIKNGQITEYVDKIKGNLNNEEINKLNTFHLKDIKDNSDAINILKTYIATSGGFCKK